MADIHVGRDLKMVQSSCTGHGLGTASGSFNHLMLNSKPRCHTSLACAGRPHFEATWYSARPDHWTPSRAHLTVTVRLEWAAEGEAHEVGQLDYYVVNCPPIVWFITYMYSTRT